MSVDTVAPAAGEVPAGNVEEEEEPEPYAPWNFSWLVEGELACMAWPQNTLNLDYLYNEGIRHLVTLSGERLPPIEGYTKLEWNLIPVDEFEDPTLKQIIQFIDICQAAKQKKQPLGVHCRMGRGRSGVMAACYLVKFSDYTPEKAIAEVRMARPRSIETPEQERVVFKYFDVVRGTLRVEDAQQQQQPPPPAAAVGAQEVQQQTPTTNGTTKNTESLQPQ